MACASERKTPKFKFIWRIKNFFFNTKSSGEYLESPRIIIHPLDNTEWFLRMYPRGRNFDCYIPCFLRRTDSDEGPESIVINYSISLMAMNGSNVFMRNVKKYAFRRSSGYGFPDFVKRGDILSSRSLYLPEDTLTVVCDMWQNNSQINSSSLLYQTFTRIGVESRSFTWKINNFTTRNWNEVVEYSVDSPSKDRAKFSMTMYLNPNSVFAEISIIRTQGNDKPVFLSCDLMLLDKKGRGRDSKKDEHLFVPSTAQLWDYPPFIKKNNLTASANQYLLNDTLTLSCVFNISSGILSEQIEAFLQNFPNKIQCTRSDIMSKVRLNLRNDIYHLYVAQKLCDLTIRNGSDYILVHQLVLSARSPVFYDMIENDATVKSTGVIEIPELDTETLSRMLVFLYTDILDNVSCEVAMKLYLAAIQYKICSLKEMCSTSMMDNMCADNVCDILEFAQNQCDNTMKSFAQDFICQNADEVFCSDKWKCFMVKSIQLASEMMHQSFLRK